MEPPIDETPIEYVTLKYRVRKDAFKEIMDAIYEQERDDGQINFTVAQKHMFAKRCLRQTLHRYVKSAVLECRLRDARDVTDVDLLEG